MDRCGSRDVDPILGFAGLAHWAGWYWDSESKGAQRAWQMGLGLRERRRCVRGRVRRTPDFELVPGSAFAFAAAHGETDVHGHRRDWTNPSDQTSGDADAAGDLSVALPVGVLAGDPGVVLRRLDISLGVNGARGDGVLAPGRIG